MITKENMEKRVQEAPGPGADLGGQCQDGGENRGSTSGTGRFLSGGRLVRVSRAICGPQPYGISGGWLMLSPAAQTLALPQP